jgi:hypothetical protein
MCRAEILYDKPDQAHEMVTEFTNEVRMNTIEITFKLQYYLAR